jgi:hypothetical protein
MATRRGPLHRRDDIIGRRDVAVRCECNKDAARIVLLEALGFFEKCVTRLAQIVNLLWHSASRTGRSEGAIAVKAVPFPALSVDPCHSSFAALADRSRSGWHEGVAGPSN